MLPERFGPFILLKRLGSGGMGDAHLARPIDADTLLVVKRIHPELAEHEKQVRRFQHEAMIATTIESPHVARVYSAGKVGATLYIAMEYIAGWPLSTIIPNQRADGRRIPIAAAIDLVSDALRGIRALHMAKDERGSPLAAVHRDVSPKNLMLGEDGRVRVIDLGLGKSRLQDWRTRTGAVMGTPGYMAPEQVMAREVDHRADLYALGLVLFEVLTLDPYIAPGSLAMMLKASASPQFRPPSSLRPQISAALDEVLKRALATDPRERFDSADAFLAALDAVKGDDPGRAPAKTLVNEPLFTELSRSRAEVEGLLASAADVDPEVVLQPTVVFARRAPDRVSTVPDVANTLPTDSSTLSRRAAKPIAPGIFTGGAIALALAVGIIIGRRTPAAETSPPPAQVEPTRGPIASSAPVGAVAPEPAPVAPIDPPKPAPTVKPRASAAPPAPEPVADAPHSPPPARSALARAENEPVDSWLFRLTEVTRTRRDQSKQNEPALEDVLVRLSRLSSKQDPATLEMELNNIARALE